MFYESVIFAANHYDMLFTNKEISKRVLAKVKEQDPVNFKSVTRNDIERLLNYYGQVISHIIKRGGFLTLSVYKTHKFNRCIRIAPIERRIIYKVFLERCIRRNMIITKAIKERANSLNQ